MSYLTSLYAFVAEAQSCYAGVASGRIPDDAMTSSSNNSYETRAGAGRLNATSFWQPKHIISELFLTRWFLLFSFFFKHLFFNVPRR